MIVIARRPWFTSTNYRKYTTPKLVSRNSDKTKREPDNGPDSRRTPYCSAALLARRAFISRYGFLIVIHFTSAYASGVGWNSLFGGADVSFTGAYAFVV